MKLLYLLALIVIAIYAYNIMTQVLTPESEWIVTEVSGEWVDDIGPHGILVKSGTSSQAGNRIVTEPRSWRNPDGTTSFVDDTTGAIYEMDLRLERSNPKTEDVVFTNGCSSGGGFGIFIGWGKE